METMKKFTLYFLAFIGLYLFVDFFAYQYISSTYKNIDDYEIVVTDPEVKILESQASSVKGNVKGTIKNTTKTHINKTFLKIDFYSKRDVLLGTKYLEIEYFNVNETLEFNMDFRFNNVAKYKVSFTNNDMTKEIEEQEIKKQENVKSWLPFAGLVTLIFLAP